MANWKNTREGILCELKPRDLFDPQSVRKLDLPNGVGAILAKRTNSQYYEAQGVRFSKKQWDRESAEKFVNETFLVAKDQVEALAKKKTIPAAVLGVSEAEQKVVYVMGLDALGKKNYKRARKLFQGLVALNPMVNLGHQGLGKVEQAEKKLDAALMAYKEALKWHPADCESLIGTAEILLQKGQKKAALPLLLQITGIDKDEIEPAGTKAREILAKQYSDTELKDYLQFGQTKVAQMAKQQAKGKPVGAPSGSTGARPIAAPAVATGPRPGPLNLGRRS